MMTAGGVAVAGIKKKGFVKIYPPKTIKLLTESKEERSLRDSVIKKIMSEMHMAKPEAIETLRYLRVIFENNPDLAAHFVVFLDLSEKEVEFIAGDKEKAKTIWAKSMNIEKKLKKEGELEARAKEAERRVEAAEEEETMEAGGEPEEELEEVEEEELTEEELEEAEEEIETVGKKEKPEKEKTKKGKQATLFDFLKK